MLTKSSRPAIKTRNVHRIQALQVRDMNRIPATKNGAAKSTDRDNAPSKRKAGAKSIRAARDHSEASPFETLSLETLYQIFSYCASISNLTTFASVCTRWRHVALDPYIWRQVREDWENFIDYALCPIHRNPAHVARTQLDHIRTIRLHGRDNSRTAQLRVKLLLCTQSRALVFKSLTRLSLHSIHLHDLGELIALAPSIEILQTRKIRCDSNKVMLSMFSGLKRLRVLDLRFKEPCEHMDNAFNMSSRRRIGLPMNLEAIRLSNVYDPEETYFVQPNNNPLRSRWMEDAFVEKYQPFTQLTRLKTLYLGRCNGFTARVWRECIMPCLKNLTHVTLAGWLDKGNDALDEALRETIGHMQTIEQLDFIDFVCSDGVIQGIQDINDRTPILAKAKFANPKLSKPITIADLLNQHVMFCRLKFANKA